jgi:D-alanine-D-alanine ligase
MKVALVCNTKKDSYKNFSPDFGSEFDSAETIGAITGALRRYCDEVVVIEADRQFIGRLLKEKVDIVFNIAEGFQGVSREAQVPAILDFLEIPYTGSGVLTLSLCLDKAKTKEILSYHRIPTPAFQLFSSPRDILDPALNFPLIVKPNHEGSAKGIQSSNLVRSTAGLYKKVEEIFEEYRQEVLVEEFIEGREITVGILGMDAPEVLPLLELDFSECRKRGEPFYTWNVKEYQGINSRFPDPKFICPAEVDKKTKTLLEALALRTYRCFDCCDFGRVDIRLDRNNRPFILEVNPLSGLDPKESNIVMMAACAGISYEDLIGRILGSALKRYGENQPLAKKDFV